MKLEVGLHQGSALLVCFMLDRLTDEACQKFPWATVFADGIKINEVLECKVGENERRCVR